MKNNPQTASIPLLRIISLTILLFSGLYNPVQANIQPVLSIDTAWLYALTGPMAALNNSPEVSDSGQLLLTAPSNCKKYKTLQKTVITSSTRGQLLDTGWQDFGDTPMDCKDEMPANQQTCSTQTIPGGSLGDQDETITTCISYRYRCMDRCSDCEASSAKQTFSVQLPSWTPLKDAAKLAAESMPMIDEFSIEVAGNVSKETGEECCLDGDGKPPVSYSQWSGTLSASISIKLNIPGWHWSFVRGWQGLFQIKAVIKLGPEVTVAPSGTISVAGKEFATNQPNCESCVTTSYTLTIGLTVLFGGEIEASIHLEFWPHTDFTAKAYAKLSLSSSIGSSGTYNWAICPNPGFSGQISYGDLTGTAQIGLEFKGYNISFSWSYTLITGASVPF
jgi:hypothetical protein